MALVIRSRTAAVQTLSSESRFPSNDCEAGQGCRHGDVLDIHQTAPMWVERRLPCQPSPPATLSPTGYAVSHSSRDKCYADSGGIGVGNVERGKEMQIQWRPGKGSTS